MNTTLVIDTRQLERFARKAGIKSVDGTVPLKRVDLYKKTRMGREWNKVKASSGGVVMGETWDPMRPQYTRKDGTEVPAWGGIAKVRGKGTVKAKMRPSGQRVTPTSIIGKDTGGLTASIMSVPPRILRRTVLEIGHQAVNALRYGKRIMGYDNRNPLRWELPRDTDAMRKIAVAYMREIIKEATR